MIVVEGPDGGGKDHLLQRILKLGGDTVKLMPRACTSDNGPIKDLGAWVEADSHNWTRAGTRCPIYNRHPMVSELIYGPLLRGHFTDPKFAQVEWLSRMFRYWDLAEPLMIYCIPPCEDMRANVIATHTEDTEHVNGVMLNLDQLWHSYVAQAARDHSRAVVWDYTSMDFSETVWPLVRWMLSNRYNVKGVLE